MQKRVLVIIILILSMLIILTACTQPEPRPIPQAPDPEPITNEKCAEYTRSGVKEQQCATCGDNICDPFEKCTPSNCDPYGCTEDCGILECPEDCPQEPPQVKLPPEKLPELTASLRTCRKDDDCVRVNADCCGCNYGGKAGAVSKEFKKSWEDTIEEKCKDIACLTMISNDWTCTADVKCVQHKCSVVKAA